METKGYRVFGAIEDIGYELPDKLRWDLVYEDILIIESENMTEAVNMLRKLQLEHDTQFKEVAAGLGINLNKECRDWWNYRPSYLMHFYYWDVELGDWDLTTDYA